MFNFAIVLINNIFPSAKTLSSFKCSIIKLQNSFYYNKFILFVFYKKHINFTMIFAKLHSFLTKLHSSIITLKIIYKSYNITNSQ